MLLLKLLTKKKGPSCQLRVTFVRWNLFLDTFKNLSNLIDVCNIHTVGLYSVATSSPNRLLASLRSASRNHPNAQLIQLHGNLLTKP